jgi:hypothetical protein
MKSERVDEIYYRLNHALSLISSLPQNVPRTPKLLTAYGNFAKTFDVEPKATTSTSILSDF